MAGDDQRGQRQDREMRLVELLTEYLQAVEGQCAPDRRQFLDRHPEVADDLAEFLEEQDRLMRLADPLRQVVRAVAPGDGDGAPPGGGAGIDPPGPGTPTRTRVRYFGDYELVGVIARGGMGVVYKARQISLNRMVALKMILGGSLASEEDVRRFRREAEAVANLDHPNIVPIYEVGEHEGYSYFSMRLVEGGSLVRQPADPWREPRAIACLMDEVASAVHHAHQRGVLHLDLKPSNILLDPQGRPHVTDFGLARQVGRGPELTRTGAVVGTPGYMAPEQASGNRKSVTMVTDVYGLGAVLYALLTGRPPFQGATLFETVERVRAGHPEPPSRVVPRLDRDLEAICLKCLEKEPERRYGSALAVAEDLGRWLQGEPTVARPLSGWARLRRQAWRRRRALSASLAAVAMLGLIALGSWQGNRLHQARRLAREQAEAIRRRDALAREARYAEDVRRADMYIAIGRAAEARACLDDERPAAGADDLRGFEWHYLRGLVQAERAGWVGHGGRDVYHVEYNPDGRTFATAGGDGAARVWDAVTGQQRVALGGHDGDVNWVSFDPDGRRLATAGEDGTVRVWDATSGLALASLDASSGEVVAALFTPDGRDVIGATRNGLLVRWDVATGRRRAELRYFGDKTAVESLAISPQGTALAAAGRGVSESVVVLYDLRDGGLTVTKVFAPGGPSYCVAFAPDGRSLAITGSRGDEAKIYNVDGQLLSTLVGPVWGAYCLAFAPDGQTLAVADDSGAFRLWDIGTRSCRGTLLGHTDRVWGVAFAPDGQTVVTASRNGGVRLWDPAQRPGRVVFRGLARDAGLAPAATVAFDGGGSRVVAANRSGDVLACDTSTGAARVLRTADVPVEGFALLAPDGATLAASDPSDPREKLVLHDLVGGRTPVRLEPHISVATLSWSPDGKRIAGYGRPGRLGLWDFSGRPLGGIPAVEGHYPGGPAFLPGGDVLIAKVSESASPSAAQEWVNWEPGRSRVDRRRFAVNESTPTGRLVLSPDGRTLGTLGEYHVVTLWDLHPLRPRVGLVGHGDSLTGVAFSPDGRTVATASLDRTVRLWGVADGRQRLVLEGHTGPVRSLVFSPDGRALASCGDGPDGAIEVIVWQADHRTADATVR